MAAPLQRMALGWTPPLLWAAAIAWASSRPAPLDLPPLLPHLDKLIHALVYSILSLLVFRAGFVHHGFGANLAALLAFGLSSAYGFTDEAHQFFVEGRHADWADWAADSAGSAAAALWAARLAGHPARHRIRSLLFGPSPSKGTQA